MLPSEQPRKSFRIGTAPLAPLDGRVRPENLPTTDVVYPTANEDGRRAAFYKKLRAWLDE